MNTQVTPKLTSYQNKLRLNRKYYSHKYKNNVNGFRDKEIKRNSERIKSKYANDPSYREQVKQRSLDRYYRLKAQKSQ
jgi:hypothetical protein